MEERVSHSGIVVGLTDKAIEIEIISSGSCGSCDIKAACAMSEAKEKRITVPRPVGRDFAVGQAVRVSMTARQGGKAAVLAYLVPAMLMVFTILILCRLPIAEWVSAVAGIGVAAAYYGVLFLLRGKIGERFEYEVE